MGGTSAAFAFKTAYNVTKDPATLELGAARAGALAEFWNANGTNFSAI